MGMADWKRLYTDASIMLDKYQNDVVPKLREQLEKRVEVVRCKDCKYYVPERKHPWNEETGYDFTKVEILQFGECRGQNAVFTEDGAVSVHENDFCSNGERRSDGST